jgi:hypothetical protein
VVEYPGIRAHCGFDNFAVEVVRDADKRGCEMVVVKMWQGSLPYSNQSFRCCVARRNHNTGSKY